MVLLWELLQLDIIDSGPEFHEDCHLHRAGWAQGLALDLGSASCPGYRWKACLVLAEYRVIGDYPEEQVST